jgi:hypothetical protein
MSRPQNTRGLWLRTRYRQAHFDGEACLLVYDVESFTDLLVSSDIKQIFEQRAGTASIFVLAPFLDAAACRGALKPGTAVLRAASYMAAKSGNLYLIELQAQAGNDRLSATMCRLTTDAATLQAVFEEPKPLDPLLREGWLFDLFDSNQGLVVAPPGVHFRKGSNKHASKFLRAANALTSSEACGLLGFFALVILGRIQPKRILVDTAPLLSLAYALMRVAKAQGAGTSDVPARSFSSYGGQRQMGRLSARDVLLISATTSGSLAENLQEQGAQPQSIVTLYYLSAGTARPPNVLCDLTVSGERGFGYQPVQNYGASDCPLCRSEHLLADLEGDQFLLQQRQHRLLRFMRTTQSGDARATLAELKVSQALEVVLRTDSMQPQAIELNTAKLLASPEVRKDFIRLMRRYCPQPLALVVRVEITEEQLRCMFEEAGLAGVVAGAEVIDWSDVASHPILAAGSGVLVIFGHLSSHMTARQINASLRSIINAGNVAYLSTLTIADTPEQYQDLKMFLAYGERGMDTFTFRDARRLALPDSSGERGPWAGEIDLLDRVGARQTIEAVEVRRNLLADSRTSRDAIFLPGKNAPLSIQRDFVFMDTTAGTADVSQADVFAVVSNLFASARSNNRDLNQKASANEVLELAQSVYGHVLLSPESFVTFNDPVLKASLLRAARPSELMYEVDAVHSGRMAEIVCAELAGWAAGTGDALPEMLLALAMQRLRLQDLDRIDIRNKALAAGLPPFLAAVAEAIPA